MTASRAERDRIADEELEVTKKISRTKVKSFLLFIYANDLIYCGIDTTIIEEF